MSIYTKQEMIDGDMVVSWKSPCPAVGKDGGLFNAQTTVSAIAGDCIAMHKSWMEYNRLLGRVVAHGLTEEQMLSEFMDRHGAWLRDE